MVSHQLIERYLDELRAEVAFRPDAEDLVAEAEDHLYAAFTKATARGASPDDAASGTIETFGQSAVIARALATTPTGGLAVPTRATVRSGIAGFVAAVCFVVGATAWTSSAILDETRAWDDVPQRVFLLGHVALSVAVAATAVLFAGVRTRHGGLGRGGLGAVVAIGFAAALTSAMSWAVPAWSALLWVGLVLIVPSTMRAGVLPRAAGSIVLAAPLLGAVVFAGLYEAEVGYVDEWGERPLASAGGVAVMALLLAAGTLMLGRALRRETPVDFGRPVHDGLSQVNDGESRVSGRCAPR